MSARIPPPTMVLRFTSSLKEYLNWNGTTNAGRQASRKGENPGSQIEDEDRGRNGRIKSLHGIQMLPDIFVRFRRRISENVVFRPTNAFPSSGGGFLLNVNCLVEAPGPKGQGIGRRSRLCTPPSCRT